MKPYIRALQDRKRQENYNFNQMREYEDDYYKTYQPPRSNPDKFNNDSYSSNSRQPNNMNDNIIRNSKRRVSDQREEMYNMNQRNIQFDNQKFAQRRASHLDESNLSLSNHGMEQFSTNDISNHSGNSINANNTGKELFPDLRSTVDELQQKNRELLNEIRTLKSNNADTEISDLRIALQNQKNRNAQLFQDLQKAENQAADAKQLLSLKETSIQAMQDECQKLRIEHQDMLTTIRLQNDQISQLSQRNRELEMELEKTRLAQPYMTAYKPPSALVDNINSMTYKNFRAPNSNYNDNIPNNFNNSYNNFNNSTYSANQNASISTSKDNNTSNTTSIAIVNGKGNVHPAMKVNIPFGNNNEEPSKASDIDAKSMDNKLLREQYELYLKKKEGKEWLLSRAPPKGMNKSHVRQEKEKLADECDELSRIVSKLKLELKMRGIF